MHGLPIRIIRDPRHRVRRWVAVALILGVAACTSLPKEHWPPFQQDKSAVVLAAGQFSGVRALDELPCLWDKDVVESGVADCWSGTPSVTQFNAFDILYGTLPGRHVRVAYHPSLHEPNVPPGGGVPTLVILLSDGKYQTLTSLRADIARTTSGQWALVVENNDSLKVLPCGAKSLIRPLEFSAPWPGRTLDEGELKNEDTMKLLRGNSNIELRGKQVHITHGIPLDDIRSFMRSLELSPDTYYCDDYDREEY